MLLCFNHRVELFYQLIDTKNEALELLRGEKKCCYEAEYFQKSLCGLLHFIEKLYIFLNLLYKLSPKFEGGSKENLRPVAFM